MNKLFGSERASIEITKQNGVILLDFYETVHGKRTRLNVPTVVLIGKEIEALQQFLSSEES